MGGTKLLAEVCTFSLERRSMQTYQHIQMCLRQYIVGSLVGKFCIGVVLGLLLLVATFMVNVPGASAHTHTICSGSDRTYIVEGGDTLSEIGYHYDISWLTLAYHNHIANPNLIYPGQTACIALHRVISKASVQAQNNRATTTVVPQPTRVVPQPAPAGSIVAMINQVFGAYAAGAINVARCESGLNPGAYNPSGASGLFQIMPGTWAGTSEAGQSPFNAYANILAAHQIFVRDGYSWREWTCQP
jgi:hypothetical protein